MYITTLSPLKESVGTSPHLNVSVIMVRPRLRPAPGARKIVKFFLYDVDASSDATVGLR